jgi:hypothetical protein
VWPAYFHYFDLHYPAMAERLKAARRQIIATAPPTTIDGCLGLLHKLSNYCVVRARGLLAQEHNENLV